MANRRDVTCQMYFSTWLWIHVSFLDFFFQVDIKHVRYDVCPCDDLTYLIEHRLYLDFLQVRKTLSDEICPELSPPRKKPRNTTQLDTSNTYFDEHSLFSQHIGELFVYLDKSARNEGILGITVEKTWVWKMNN